MRQGKQKKENSDELSYESQLDALVQKGRSEGMLTFEELAAFAQKHSMTEEDHSEVMQLLEKENIDLVSQDDLLADVSLLDDFLKEEGCNICSQQVKPEHFVG